MGQAPPRYEQLSLLSFLDEDNTAAFIIDIPARYQGPLDTLLDLINRHKLDIYDVPIAFILDRYLEELETIKKLNLPNIGEHFEMVAMLMRIKSQELLPKTPSYSEASDDNPRQELVRRLVSHRRKNDLVKQFRILEEERNRQWEHFGWEPEEPRPGKTERVLTTTLRDLCDEFQRLQQRQPEKTDGLEVNLNTISVQAKMEELLEQLPPGAEMTFTDFFHQALSRQEWIVMFLALLELVHVGVVRVRQGQAFGAILLSRAAEKTS
jgi:segregation and condensation protein A